MNKQRILVLLTIIASPLFAQESTATPCSKGDIVLQLQCLDQAIIDHKRTRQTWITKLEKQVELKQNHTGNTQLFLSFQRSKHSFDSYISDSCQWRYLNELPDTKHAALKYKRCELKIIDQQVEILKGQF